VVPILWVDGYPISYQYVASIIQAYPPPGGGGGPPGPGAAGGGVPPPPPLAEDFTPDPRQDIPSLKVDDGPPPAYLRICVCPSG
jgi:hypothetical protein